MTTMCPMPAAVAPPPITSRSITITRRPRRTNSSAQAAPTMPAPIITTSKVSPGFVIQDSGANSHAERIVYVEHQIRLRVYKRRPLDAGINFSVTHAHASFEDAAHNAFLLPDVPLAEFAVGIKARQLRAGSRAARRAVIRLTRTQHKILAVHSCNL